MTLPEQSNSGPTLAWTLRRDGMVLTFTFEIGASAAVIGLGVEAGVIAEEPGYSIGVTSADAESLATALSTWSRS